MSVAKKQIAPALCSRFAVPNDLDLSGKPRTYRLTGYYKEKQKPQFAEHDWLGQILWESEEENVYGEKNIMLVKCSRKEAEFVSGAGIAGCIRRIQDIEVIGMVNWSEEEIREEQEEYDQFLACDDRMPLGFSPYWEKDWWNKTQNAASS